MSDATVPRLRLRGLTKSFGGARALDRADLTILPGEVHGLLGKNGSGKSTLIKVLSGYHAPEAGTLEIAGRPVRLPMPLGRSEAEGLAFVHQNLGLLAEATVLENLIAGDHQRLNPWRIGWRTEAARASRLFEENHLAISPTQQVADLSPVQRAQLAILRAADRVREHRAHGSPGILVLDEPTPFLPREDVRTLFATMRRLTATGVAILFVSHDIDEVLEVTDRATVLRDGQVIATFETAVTGRAALVEAIVGRAVSADRLVAALPTAAPVAARIEGLGGAILRDVSLSVRRGEVLGLTGLIGAGHDEAAMLVSGARPARSGRLTLSGGLRGESVHDLTRMTPAAAIAAGLALIPADRQRAGIAPDLSLTENATLPLIGGRLALDHRRLRGVTADLIERYAVKAEGPEQPASDLSGGNQQKLVLAKWLHLEPRLVLLDEPTQGIDVGARRDVYETLAALCARGGAILCATSEFEQLEAIAHRVLVFDRGRIVAELEGDDVTKSAIAQACYDRTGRHAAA